MRVYLYLFPDYVNMRNALARSPILRKLLQSEEVEIVERRWVDGTLEELKAIPEEDGLVLVRTSTRMHCRIAQVAQLCQERGYVCFYEDQTYDETGVKLGVKALADRVVIRFDELTDQLGLSVTDTN